MIGISNSYCLSPDAPKPSTQKAILLSGATGLVIQPGALLTKARARFAARCWHSGTSDLKPAKPEKTPRKYRPDSLTALPTGSTPSPN